MILGIFPPQGGSISSLRRTGQDSRFIRSYLGSYAQHFEKVYYFSYAKEEADLPFRCHLVKNPGYHRWAYAFLLPIVQRRYIRQCDVLRVMQMYGAIPAVVAKLLYGMPYVGTYGYHYLEHARTQGMKLRAHLFEWRARLGLRLADGVIVTTKTLHSYVTECVPKDKVALIPNGVDTTLFHPAGVPRGQTEKVVVCVGRLAPQKNLFMLIDAVALIRELRVRLVLVGGGALSTLLKEHATRKGVSLELKGVVPHEELPAILGSADVFALPSLHEGHPKVLLEAMSCGVPCVGTNVQGIEDVIEDGENGLLSQLTAEDLAARIIQILSNEGLAEKLRHTARRFVEENFDLEALLAKETATLKTIAASRNL